MRIRSLVLCAVLAGAALGAAGCSSSASSSSKAPAKNPTGTVSVVSGGKVVCTIKLDKNGTGTCKVSTANDKPGQIKYTGTYSGDGSHTPSSGSVTIILKPAQQTS
jgi:hypothetical protein